MRLQGQASFPNTETLSTSLIRRHPLTGALVALAALAALLAAAAPAAAAPSCGRQVIDDWYDDGRVDGTYALHCYDDAIEALPRDVRDYSSAKEDIERALQARLRGEPAPPASSDPSPAGEDPDDPVSNEDPDDSTGSGTGSGSDPDAGGAEAAGETDGESASSVPLPLLVLAGLALLLIAGGSAGYLVRRFRGGEAPPPAV